jgi:hypothetical protein
MATNLNDSYQVDGSDNSVILIVTIGYAQTATSTVKINGVKVITSPASATGIYTDSFQITLDGNANLNGKTLIISNSVVRIQATQQTSVQVTLKGGPNSKTFPLLSANAANIGDETDYLILIQFTA